MSTQYNVRIWGGCQFNLSAPWYKISPGANEPIENSRLGGGGGVLNSVRSPHNSSPVIGFNAEKFTL